MRYEVIEYHWDPDKSRDLTTKVLEPVTNMRREIERLAKLRRAGDMAPTLSHWTVGGHRVVAQTALEIMDRLALAKLQGEGK